MRSGYIPAERSCAPKAHEQGSTSTRSIGSGIGLGLSICHGIVTGFGGDIRVESEPGRGACFRVFLQVGSPPVEAAEPVGARADSA